MNRRWVRNSWDAFLWVMWIIAIAYIGIAIKWGDREILDYVVGIATIIAVPLLITISHKTEDRAYADLNRLMRINRDTAPDLSDDEIAEYEQVLNAAMRGNSPVIGERQPDGTLRIRKVDTDRHE